MSEPLEKPGSGGSFDDRSLPQWAPEVDSIIRQPLLDEFGLRHGYELRFKSPGKMYPGCSVSDTLAVLDNVVLFGLERLTANSLAFLYFDREVPTDGLADLLMPSMTVLEIPARIPDSPNLLAACRNLRRAGFRLALRDFPETPIPLQLLEMVQYVKVDAGCIEAGVGARIRKHLHGSKAAMVATGIHSQAGYRRACAEGFQYFQGFYFCSPAPVQLWSGRSFVQVRHASPISMPTISTSWACSVFFPRCCGFRWR